MLACQERVEERLRWQVLNVKVEELFAGPKEKLLFAGWDVEQLVGALGVDVEVRSPYSLWALGAPREISIEAQSLCRGASFVAGRTGLSVRRMLEHKIENVWLGLDPILLLTEDEGTQAQEEIVAVISADTPIEALTIGCERLLQVGEAVCACVLEGSPFSSGASVMAAREAGFLRVRRMSDVGCVLSAVREAKVICLCPEAVYLAARYGRPVLVPPVSHETLSAAADLQYPVCDSWDEAIEDFANGDWAVQKPRNTRRRLAMHTLDKAVDSLGAVE